MRAFIALDLPEGVIDALGRLQGALRGWRLMDEDTLHLTLAFLDDQSEDRLEALHHVLDGLPFAPIPLSFETLDLIGAGRALALSVRASDALSDLHGAVSSAAHSVGMDLPRRRFRPHVTIARRKIAAGEGPDMYLQSLVRDIPQTSATGFSLYRSTLAPQGARHEVLASYGVGASLI